MVALLRFFEWKAHEWRKRGKVIASNDYDTPILVLVPMLFSPDLRVAFDLAMPSFLFRFQVQTSETFLFLFNAGFVSSYIATNTVSIAACNAGKVLHNMDKDKTWFAGNFTSTNILPRSCYTGG